MLIDRLLDEWLMAVATIARGDSGHDTHNTWTMRIESLRWGNDPSFPGCEGIRARRRSNDEFRLVARVVEARTRHDDLLPQRAWTLSKDGQRPRSTCERFLGWAQRSY